MMLWWRMNAGVLDVPGGCNDKSIVVGGCSRMVCVDDADPVLVC